MYVAATEIQGTSSVPGITLAPFKKKGTDTAKDHIFADKIGDTSMPGTSTTTKFPC